MQKSFSAQPKLFVSTSDLDHPVLHRLDDTEALLEWSEIERLLASIYASKTGRPSYPLLTLFRGLLLGLWYRLADGGQALCHLRRETRGREIAEITERMLLNRPNGVTLLIARFFNELA